MQLNIVKLNDMGPDGIDLLHYLLPCYNLNSPIYDLEQRNKRLEYNKIFVMNVVQTHIYFMSVYSCIDSDFTRLAQILIQMTYR